MSSEWPAKERLLRVATRLFAEKGYESASIRDLSNRSGLKRGGIYHYIEAKQDLLYWIHERSIDPLCQEFRAIGEAGYGPEERLYAYGRALLRDIRDFKDEVLVVFSEWRVIKHDPRWQAIREKRSKVEADIEATLEEGMASGAFRIHDAKMARLGFLGMLNYSSQWFDPEGELSSDEVAELFCDIFLRGIVN